MDYEKEYKDLLTSDKLGMRERIVLEILRNRPKYTADMTTAAALILINFIENNTTKILSKSEGVSRSPSLPLDFEVFLPPKAGKRKSLLKPIASGSAGQNYLKGKKRKYTKKSKYWAKKKNA